MAAPGQAEAREAHRERDLLPEALQEVHRAVHKTTIYPPEHPEVQNAIQIAGRALGEALAGQPRLVMGVGKDHVLIDHEVLETPLMTVASLARTLHELDVAAVELRCPVPSVELARFVMHVAAARRGGEQATLPDRLKEANLQHIGVSFLDYRGLAFSPWDESVERDPAQDVWDRLVNTLTDLASYQAGTVMPADLAAAANRRLCRCEETDVAPLRRRMHAMTRRLEAMNEEQREALKARLAGFVSRLSPELRSELVRVDPLDDESGEHFVEQLAGSLPDPVLLDVLRDIDCNGEKVPGHFLTFLSKVARVSSEQTTAAGNLQDVLGRWGVSQNALAGDATAMRGALEEVFRQRTQDSCNPESYQHLLEDLAQREIPQATRRVFARYRDPRNPVDVQAQVAEIAVRLLEEEGGAEDRAGLLGFLGAATDQLLEGGQYHSVRDAAVAAKHICSTEEDDEETRLAAEGYLRDLTAEERIDRLLDRACRGESVPRAVAALLALGGALALGRILDFLDQGPSPRVASVLQKLATRMGLVPMEDVLEARSVGGWERLRPAFRIIRFLPGRDAVVLLDRLLEHEETRVRREALTVLCEVDRRPGTPERHLERALQDEDNRLVVFGIQQLFALGRPACIELLGRFVEGSLRGADPGPAFTRRAAQGMVALGCRGRHRLCGSLDHLRGRLRLRAARSGSLISQVLAPHGDDPAVRRALSRWRYSPAGLLALAGGTSAVDDPGEDSP